jgi:hypothetical protein
LGAKIIPLTGTAMKSKSQGAPPGRSSMASSRPNSRLIPSIRTNSFDEGKRMKTRIPASSAPKFTLERSLSPTSACKVDESEKYLYIWVGDEQRIHA